MIEGCCVDDHELVEVVLVGDVVPVPSNYVEAGVVLAGGEQVVLFAETDSVLTEPFG